MTTGTIKRCILCHAKTDGDFICFECREAFMHYKTLYKAEKLAKQGCSIRDILDGAKFEQYYYLMEMDDTTEEEKDEVLKTPTLELIKEINEGLKDERSNLPLSDEEMVEFINYMKRRIMKEREKE